VGVLCDAIRCDYVMVYCDINKCIRYIIIKFYDYITYTMLFDNFNDDQILINDSSNNILTDASNAAPTPMTRVFQCDNGAKIVTTGTMKMCGDNQYGELGDASNVNTSIFGYVEEPDSSYNNGIPLVGVTKMAFGSRHSLALMADGIVKSWGDNTYGQLGDGTTTSRSLPVNVVDICGNILTDVSNITCGFDHSIALMVDGTLRSWGAGTKGQLGDGDTIDRPYAVLVTDILGDPLANVIDVAGGQYHSVAVVEPGYITNVKGWGNNSWGQLGTIPSLYQTPPSEWTRQNSTFNTSGDDIFPGIGVDSIGNSYVAYYTTGIVSGGTPSGGNDIVVYKLDTSGTTLWTRQNPTFNTSAFDATRSIAVDFAGSVYVTYYTEGTTSGGTLNGTHDIVIFKLDTNGTTLWTRQNATFNTSVGDFTPSITVDSTGNAYVAYFSLGVITNGTNTGGFDIIVVKLDSNGNTLWKRQNATFNTIGNEFNPSISVDPFGNVYVAQLSNGTVSGGTTTGNNDIIVYKLDSNGTTLWTRQNSTFNTSGSDDGPSISVDSLGNAYVAHYTNGIVSSGTFSGGTGEIVVYKLDSNGNTIWTRQNSTFNTTGDDVRPSISVNPDGNIYVAYDTGGTVSGGTSTGAGDIVVFCLDSAGNTLWTLQNPTFNTSGVDQVPSIRYGPQGNFYVAYYTGGTASGGTFSGINDIVVFKRTAPILYPQSSQNFIEWTQQTPIFNTSVTDFTPSISVDPTGSAYVAYRTSGGTVSGGTNSGSNDIVVFKVDSNGTTLWTRQNPTFNSNGADNAPSIITDSSGNAYIAYYTSGTVSGGTSTIANDIVVFKLDTNGNTIWTRQTPTFNSSGNDESPSIAVDSSRNSYVAYHSNGTISGGVPTGTQDIIVFKLDSNGDILWTRQNSTFNTNQYDAPPSISVDSVGNSYIAYYTIGGIVSGGANAGGTYDIVVFKLDTNGNTVWTRQNVIFNTYGSDFTPSISVDFAGNINVAYYTSGTVSGGTLTSIYDIVVFKLDSAGTILWTRQNNVFNTSENDNEPSIMVDHDGNVYIAYTTTGAVIGGTNTGGDDIVVFKLDTGGNTVWTRQTSAFNTSQSDTVPSLDVDANGDVYVAYISGGIVSGGTFSGGSYDIVVFKMLGSQQDFIEWTRQSPTFNTSGDDTDHSMIVDPIGNVYVAYSTDGVASGGTFSDGIYDIVVFKLGPNGDTLWTRQNKTFNTYGLDGAPSIGVDFSGNTYIAYNTSGTISGESNSGGSIDIVVFKLDTDGNLIWTRQNSIFNTIASDEIPSLIADPFGNSYIAYRTQGVVSGGVNNGSYDIVVYKLDSNGNTLWTRQNSIFNTAGVNTFPSISVDVNGDVYVTYYTDNVVSGGTFSGGSYDIVVFKLDTNGNTLWTCQNSTFNTSGSDVRPSITADYTGNIYVTYETSNVVSGGTTSGGTDIVVLKLDASGNIIWTRQNSTFNTNVSDSTPSISVDNAGYAYVAYRTTGEVLGGTNTGGYDIIVFKLDTNGNTIWTRQTSSFNTSGNDDNPLICVDSTGTIYVTYNSSGTISGGTSSGGTNDIVVVKMLSDSNKLHPISLFQDFNDLKIQNFIEWTRQNSTFNTSSLDNKSSIVVDSLGNVYIVYDTDGTVSGGTNVGGRDIVVFKLDSNGNTLWTRQNFTFNTDQPDQLPSLSVDSSCNVYIAYQTTGGIVSGGNYTGGAFDIIVYKLDTNGNALWTRQNSTFNTSDYDSTPSISTDPTGNTYVSYWTTNGIVSGGTNSGNHDIIVYKLDPNGNTLWTRQTNIFNTSASDFHPSTSVDSYGNVYVAYYTTGTVSGGNYTGGTGDIVVFKIDQNGNTLWTQQNSIFNTIGEDAFPSISASSVGVYVAYRTTGVVSSGTNTGGWDIVVFKLDSNGNTLWTQQNATFNTDSDDNFPSISSDFYDNVYVAYSSDGGTVSGGINATFSSIDIISYKLDPSGNTLWTRQNPIFNTTGTDISPSISVDSNGNVYVTYLTDGTVSGGVLGGGTRDIVVFKIGQYKIKSVACGQLHTLLLLTDPKDQSGNILACGRNVEGQLGDGTTISRGGLTVASPVYVTDTPGTGILGNVASITCGSTHSVALLNDGTVKSWGNNAYGQLGDSSLLSKLLPVDVLDTDGSGVLTTVVKVSSKNDHSMFLIGDGTVTGCGYNTSGQLGNNSTTSSSLPVVASGINNAVDIGAGGLMSGIITDEDRLLVRVSNILDTKNNANMIYQLGTPIDCSDTPGLSIVLSNCTSINGQGWGVNNYVVQMIATDSSGTSSNPLIGQINGDDFYWELLDICGNGVNPCQLTNFKFIFDGSGSASARESLVAFDALQQEIVCVSRDTQILMHNGTYKAIQDIERGNVVAGDLEMSKLYRVSRVNRQRVHPSQRVDLVSFDKDCLGSNQPIQRLVITCNHALIYNGKRRPAKCFENLYGVTKKNERLSVDRMDHSNPLNYSNGESVFLIPEPDGGYILYDLQFETLGSYVANGVVVQSRSPRSRITPLPRSLYFNRSLYRPRLGTGLDDDKYEYPLDFKKVAHII